MASLLARLLFAVAVTYLSSGALAQEDALTAPASSASSSESPVAPAAPTLAPIASAAPGSSTFQFVPNAICSDAVGDKINVLYAKNRNMFDECVSDADYQIFPYSGQAATTQQVRAMATSSSCIAIFTAVVLADFPACDNSGLPIKATAETLLKIKVDIDDGREAASELRFKELMAWRRDVNLAQEAGVPFDSSSVLYGEYTANLQRALSSTTVRVSADFMLEYELPNGTYTRGETSFSMLKADSGSSKASEAAVGSVRPAGSSDGLKAAGSLAQDLVKADVNLNVSSSAPASLMQHRTPASSLALALVVAMALTLAIFV